MIRRNRGRRRGRRTWRERAVLVLSGSLSIALMLTAGGLAYVYTKYAQLTRVTLGSVLTDSGTEEPQNFLLVGVDSAANLDPGHPATAGRASIGGLRSDTVMVLRVEPRSGEAALLSVPRDLWVPLASGGNQRINAAIQHGGPGELIDTIEQYLGIPVHHYVQVDFAGFQELVEVIDGVDVYFPTPARDTRSGLEVDGGCVRLDGQTALAYVRSRHYQRFEDGRWRTDPSADLGRITRQQDFIIRALHRAIDRGVRNPLTLDRLADAGLQTVTVDDRLTANEIITLGRALRSFDPGAVRTYSLPVTAGSAGGASILRLRDDEAQPILDLFRGTDGGNLRPHDVRVQILNGSGITGHARETSEGLVAAGFTSVGMGEAERFDVAETIVRYTAGREAQADLVARHLDPSARLELVAGPLSADVVVVTGQLLTGVRAEPRPPGPSTTAPTIETSTSSTLPTSSTTSTTAVGYVPQAPPGVDC